MAVSAIFSILTPDIDHKVLIGRTTEREILTRCSTDNRSHFLVIYGRRRVGKTFLIRQQFNNQFDFYATGLANADTRTQLTNFSLAVRKFHNHQEFPVPESWLEAFNQLIQLLEASKSKKKIVFLDELPWMDTPRSKFLTGLEYFWNSWASARNDVLLIGCGSAASWMLNKLINNKRGLYNRVTRRIHLSPFKLSEVEKFLIDRKYKTNRYQILQLYMALGGIPFYLDLIDPRLSVAQNIQRIFFEENAPLANEYDILLRSLFDDSDRHREIIEALTKKKTGLTRKEILKEIDIEDGGGVTRTISELIASDFIRKYNKYGNKNRDAVYQLIDPFTLFHYRFVEHYQPQTNYWINQINTPAIYTWQGNAFEMLCLQHVDELKDAIGISGVQTNTSTWWGQGAQIDLIIDRKDQVINLIEIKFALEEYVISKDYDAKLRKKVSAFKEETGSRKALWTTMLTTYGLKENKYSSNVQLSLDMNDLF